MVLKIVLLLCCLPLALSLTACPDGWTKYQRSCYLFPNIQAAWGTALTICKALRPTSKLVEIETTEENTFLESHLRDLNAQDSYWTGGNDIENENNWIWATSRTNFGFNDWDKSDPNNIQPNNLGQHEDCMELNGKFSYRWYDADCSSKIYFICEIETSGHSDNGVVGLLRYGEYKLLYHEYRSDWKIQFLDWWVNKIKTLKYFNGFISSSRLLVQLKYCNLS